MITRVFLFFCGADGTSKILFTLFSFGLKSLLNLNKNRYINKYQKKGVKLNKQIVAQLLHKLYL